MPDGLKLGQGGLPWADDHHCIVCGSENPIGLKLKFVLDGESLVTDWQSDKRFQGYADVLHGGIIATILDEVMVNLPWKRDGIPVLSAEMTVRFIRPAKVGERLSFRSETEKGGRRLIRAQATCKGEDGSLVAEATAKCLPIKNPNL
jgi:uncharacterized protein (TIGR00369 family)